MKKEANSGTMPRLAVAAMIISAGISAAAIDTLKISGGPASSKGYAVSVPLGKIEKITVSPYTISIDTGNAAIARPVGGGNGPVRIRFIQSSVAVREKLETRDISARIHVQQHGSRVTIGFSINSPGYARIDVCRSDGKHVQRLLDGFREAGRCELIWDQTTLSGHRVLPGAYFITGTIERRIGFRQILIIE